MDNNNFQAISLSCLLNLQVKLQVSSYVPVRVQPEKQNQ